MLQDIWRGWRESQNEIIEFLICQSVQLASKAKYIFFKSAHLLLAIYICPGEILGAFLYCLCNSTQLLSWWGKMVSVPCLLICTPALGRLSIGSIPLCFFSLVVVMEMRSRVWKSGVCTLCLHAWMLYEKYFGIFEKRKRKYFCLHSLDLYVWRMQIINGFLKSTTLYKEASKKLLII